MSKLLKSMILGISIVAMQTIQAAEPIILTRGHLAQLAKQITFLGTVAACFGLSGKVLADMINLYNNATFND